MSLQLTGFDSLESLIQHYDPDGTGLRLDLGCGYYKAPGYVGVDNLIGARTQVPSGNMPDVLMDLNAEPLPFGDRSCMEVRSSHFLEHSNLDHIIDESWRVLNETGRFTFTVPYANSAEGLYPGHLIFLTEKWFQENINFQKRFVIAREEYVPSAYYFELSEAVRRLFPFDVARKVLFNVCREMTLSAAPKK